MFIVFHSVLSSQPVNGETFVLSLESIPHDLSHMKRGNLPKSPYTILLGVLTGTARSLLQAIKWKKILNILKSL